MSEYLNSNEDAQMSLARLVMFVVFFTMVYALQTRWPYRSMRQKIYRNLAVNLSLATINSMLLLGLNKNFLLPLIHWHESRSFGFFYLFQLPAQIGFYLQCAVAVLTLDLAAYFWHRANHHFSFLWRFHRVHHTDQVFEVSTAVRFHIGELLLSFVLRLLLLSLFGFSFEVLMVFEIIYQSANLFAHSNLRLSRQLEDRLNMLFVSPCMHRKHHSVQSSETHSNFATIFSFWDRLFGSYRASSSNEEIVIGLPATHAPPCALEQTNSVSISKLQELKLLLVMPFKSN